MGQPVKGIYLMTCSPRPLDEAERNALSGHALQSLKLSDPAFRDVDARLERDRPRFYQSFVQMAVPGQPRDVLEKDFHGWLRQRGVAVNRQTWDSHFFHVEKTVPASGGVETRHVLIYFHTTEAEIEEANRPTVEVMFSIVAHPEDLPMPPPEDAFDFSRRVLHDDDPTWKLAAGATTRVVVAPVDERQALTDLQEQMEVFMVQKGLDIATYETAVFAHDFQGRTDTKVIFMTASKANRADRIAALESIDPGLEPFRFQSLCDELGDAQAAGAVPKLLALLKGRPRSRQIGGNNRESAIRALGLIADPHAVEALIEELNNSDTRYAAAVALGRLGDARAVEPLLAVVQSDSWADRSGAARSLGMLGDERAVEPLRALLDDPREDVRQSVDWALTKLGASDTDWYLDTLATQHVKERLVELGIVDLSTVSKMFNMGTYLVRSVSGATMDPVIDTLVLTNVSIGDGVCMSTIQVDRIEVQVAGSTQPGTAGVGCSDCGAFIEIKAAVTETPSHGQEIWLITNLAAIPKRHQGNPNLGWPRIGHAQVAITSTPSASRAPSEGERWRLQQAGAESRELIESGDLGEDSLRQFSVYRIVTPHGEVLDREQTMVLRGVVVCAVCGYEVPLDTRIGLKGFFGFSSKHTVACPQCNALTLLVGNTTEPIAGTARHWLLATQETGPPGTGPLPGTTSGLPELRIDHLERAAE